MLPDRHASAVLLVLRRKARGWVPEPGRMLTGTKIENLTRRLSCARSFHGRESFLLRVPELIVSGRRVSSDGVILQKRFGVTAEELRELTDRHVLRAVPRLDSVYYDYRVTDRRPNGIHRLLMSWKDRLPFSLAFDLSIETSEGKRILGNLPLTMEQGMDRQGELEEFWFSSRELSALAGERIRILRET